jgi:N-acetylglucosamine-6-phosphate deacetylase
MQTALRARRLWTGRAFRNDPLVVIEDGRIRSIAAASAAPKSAQKLLEFPDATLSPAFFDVHMHGGAGHDLMEGSAAAVAAVSRLLAAHGVGAYLATTVTAPLDKTLRTLSGLAREIAKAPEPGRARLLGVHLEGPFLAHKRRGAHPSEYLLQPDLALFDRLQEAAEGQIKVMTLAPELDGACELARHATQRGVRVSLGHSEATAEQTRALIAAGAVSATHTYNAMRPMESRDPGVLGEALTNDALYAELICDGVHVAPEMVKLWWKAKGRERGILMTDAISATGMPDGVYKLGEYDVEVANGRAMTHGSLAGSVLTLDRALLNFMRFTDAKLEEALPLLTTNPAAMTGLNDCSQALAEGAPANLVALSENGELLAAIIGGQRTDER